MKRIDRVYEYILEHTKGLRRNDLTDGSGVETTQIAADLGLLRNNVSMELNTLFRAGRIVKIGGRPVRYLDRNSLERIIDQKIPAAACQYASISEFLQKFGAEELNPFARLIGAKGSLKKQVEQAKAAILYPPNGLHTLIVGQTGVGKTLLAHLMFEYGRVMHKFDNDAPLITFNCADYYTNPQLLISHIFGHIKGAFTGADTAKAGLVEAADGGVLFLDEIHRLPPEGQEMIFYFMDTGTFNRLGETVRNRNAKILIIGATTEDPDSALTKTFVRRIPNIISIPPLAERLLEEKIAIIRQLFSEEAALVKKPIKIGLEAFKAIIGSIDGGNVGKLKSNIKLLCAQAFLNGLDNPNCIEIYFSMLPTTIKSGLLTLSANRQDLAAVAAELSDFVLIMPPGESSPPASIDENKNSFDLYRVVEDKVSLLKGEGISDEMIKQVVANDVNVYVNLLYDKKKAANMTTRERLLKIVDESLVDFAEQVSLLVQNELNRSYSDCFLYAFSLHLSAFLKRVKSQETFTAAAFETVPTDSRYYQTALKIKTMVEQYYHIPVTTAEISYIALLLESAQDNGLEERVTIVVTAHGRNTATSMAEVAQKLFGADNGNLIAIDMPLTTEPQEILDKIAATLGGLNLAKGVLVLADMGSLCSLGPLLAAKLHTEIRTLDMVSTPLILEAMRKADIIGMDLDNLYDSLRRFKGYETIETAPTVHDKKDAIVTICASGQGAAVKLKSLVEEILLKAGQYVEVLPIGLVKLEEKIRALANEYHIIAAVGMKKPHLDIPFVPLEQLLGGEGESIITELVFNHELGELPVTENNLVVKSLCEESLQKFLTYLNPSKVIGVLWEFDVALERELGRKLSNPIRIRLLVHSGCALERAIIKSPLVYKYDRSKIDKKTLTALKNAAKVFQKTLKLNLAEDEFYFLANMI